MAAYKVTGRGLPHVGGPSFCVLLALPVALPGVLAVRVYPGAFAVLPGGMPCGVSVPASLVALAACGAFCGLLRGFGPVWL